MGRGPNPEARGLSREVSDVIDTERQLRGLSVRSLARLSDIDRSKAQRLINGDSSWTLTELEDVCSTLDLRVSTVVAQAERRQGALERVVVQGRFGVTAEPRVDHDREAQAAALDIGRQGGEPEPGAP